MTMLAQTHSAALGRRANKSRTSRSRGFFASAKTGARVRCRSHRDRLFCIWAETEPAVASYGPGAEALAIGPRGKRWLPDFEFIRSGERVLVQLSRADASISPELSERIEAAKQGGCEFLLLEERLLAQEPQLANRKLLLRARGHTPDPADRAMLLGAVIGGERNLGELCALLTSGRPRDDVFALCLEGALAVLDLDWPISALSMLACGRGGRHE